MAFDAKGLFYAQFAATLEYADDQVVQLDDFEHRLVSNDRHLDVEIYFSNPVRTVTSFLTESKKRTVTDTHVRFVTMFQSLTYCLDGEYNTITLIDATDVGSEFTPLSQIDQLRLLTMAIEHCAVR